MCGVQGSRSAADGSRPSDGLLEVLLAAGMQAEAVAVALSRLVSGRSGTAESCHHICQTALPPQLLTLFVNPLAYAKNWPNIDQKITNPVCGLSAYLSIVIDNNSPVKTPIPRTYPSVVPRK